MTNLLITGATGSIGSHIVKQLRDKGISLRALVRSQAKAERVKEEGVETVIGDLAQPETLPPALDGIERAFLLTVADPAQVEWQGNFIDAARAAGVKQVVKLSALGAAADSPINLARWHWQTEQDLQNSGLAYTILQPHFFMQNLLGFAQSIAAEGKFYAPMKDGRVGMVDVRDIAAVAVAALTETGHDQQTYLITGPEAISFSQAADKIAAAIGKPVTYVDVPREAARQAMLEMGIPDWFVADMVSLYTTFSQGHGEVVTDVVERVAKKTAISFGQFAHDYAAAFKGA